MVNGQGQGSKVRVLTGGRAFHENLVFDLAGLVIIVKDVPLYPSSNLVHLPLPDDGGILSM